MRKLLILGVLGFIAYNFIFMVYHKTYPPTYPESICVIQDGEWEKCIEILKVRRVIP